MGTVGHSGSYNLYTGIAKQLAANDSLWEGDLGHSTVGEACYLHLGRCWRMELRRDCSLIPRACFRMDHHWMGPQRQKGLWECGLTAGWRGPPRRDQHHSNLNPGRGQHSITNYSITTSGTQYIVGRAWATHTHSPRANDLHCTKWSIMSYYIAKHRDQVDRLTLLCMLTWCYSHWHTHTLTWTCTHWHGVRHLYRLHVDLAHHALSMSDGYICGQLIARYNRDKQDPSIATIVQVAIVLLLFLSLPFSQDTPRILPISPRILPGYSPFLPGYSQGTPPFSQDTPPFSQDTLSGKTSVKPQGLIVVQYT